MLRNYVIIAWRNLRKNKMFSLINILGLGIGMACTMLILLWIYHEKSWNKEQPNYDQVYQVKINRNFNGEISTSEDLMFPFAKAVKQAIPEVKASTVVSFGEPAVLSKDNSTFSRKILRVSESFFQIFKYPFLEGAPEGLMDPNGIILTKGTATAIFGKEKVVGKQLVMQNNTLVVTAVVDNPLPTSTLQFDALLPYHPNSAYVKEVSNEWVNCSYRTFVLLSNNVHIATTEQKMIQVIRERTGTENPTTRGSIIMHPMSKWRLYQEFRDGKNIGGRIQYVRLFGWTALVILIIACANFMNLSTARSQKRAREVGIRKTLGSSRQQLILQFICESMILSLIAFLIAIGLVFLAIPLFRSILQQALYIPYNDPIFWIGAVLMIVVTGMLAGSYPALFLSSMKPVKVLKGQSRGKKGILPRHILVTVQFSISIILIAATLIIYQQINHVQKRNLGFNANNMLMVQGSSELNRQYDAFKQELLQTGIASAVNRTSTPLNSIYGYTSGVRWAGSPADPNLIIGFISSDVDLVSTIGANLLEGRDFAVSDSNVVLFNKEAIRVMQMNQPIGNTIQWAGRERTIVGVIDNLVLTSPYAPPSPLMIVKNKGGGSNINIRIAAGVDTRKALDAIGDSYKIFSGGTPFEYRFADAAFNEKFANEQMIAILALLFACLAIFVSCLGLFGLVSFSIEKRTKEIGIRRLLGASIQQLLALISREFLVLIGISFTIGVPIAWLFMHQWLQDFSYRTDIRITPFLLVGLITLLICIVTISLNAYKATTNNPVKSLRNE